MQWGPLVQDAVDRVWCSPKQDYQAIYRVNRLTSASGARKTWSSLMVDIDLPDALGYFHLFSFGQLVPELAALFPCDSVYPQEQVWTSLLESANAYHTVVDVYFENGVKVPLSECFFMITDEKALVLAVRDLPMIGCVTQAHSSSVRFGFDRLYVRIYKNAYFSSNGVGVNESVFYACTKPKTVSELIALQAGYELYAALPGFVQAYRNGYLVDKIALTTCEVGDWLWFVYDSSVKMVCDFPLDALPFFLSNLDGKQKYLLHCEKPSIVEDNKIEYHDDVDLFLWRDDKTYVNGVVDPRKVSYLSGVYVHKNTPGTMRMVTHRDYAVPVSLISVYLEMHLNTVLLQTGGLTDKIHLKMVVRKSGYDRPLVDDANRIKELYKLPDTKIIQAMVGPNALVPTWQASNLESSGYCELMGWEMAQPLTNSAVAKAYGYDSVVNLLAKPVVRTRTWSSQLIADCPPAFEKNSTGFEFDEQGKLLGWHYHDAGVYYNCRENNTKYVEFIRGSVSGFADEYHNQPTQTLDLRYDWGFYITPKSVNPQTTPWECVNGDNKRYLLNKTTGVLNWLCSETHFTVVRSNATAVVLEKTLDLVEGILGFNITLDKVVDGVKQALPTPIAFGEIDVWINGSYAVRGLDYRLNWPHVCLVNKSYLVPNGLQRVVVRVKGLCDNLFGFVDETEYGFVINGRLSVDRTYDVRKDKASVFYLAGGVKLLDELVFVEENPTFDLLSPLNGKPYIIKDTVVEIKDYAGSYTSELRKISTIVDRTVGNYLTEHGFGLEMPTQYNPIQNLHRLYSPFISSVISDMKRGYLNPVYLTGQYNNNDVFETLKSYEYLLKYDPIHDDNMVEKDFVIIDPHCWATPIDLTIHQYLFLQRVITLYAGDKVKYANHLRVSA